jgi:hypothetical protein
MKKWVLLAFTSMLLATPVKAADNVIDVSTLKCADIEKMDQAAIGTFITWIDGFLGGKADDTKFDIGRFQKDADAVDKICKDHPDEGVLSAFKEAENN